MRAFALALGLLLFGRLALFGQPSGAQSETGSLQTTSSPAVSTQVIFPWVPPLQAASSQLTSSQITPLQATSSSSTASQGTSSQSTSSGGTSSSSGSSSGQSAGSGQQSAQPTGPQPVPYSPDEFPRWMRDLRRGEVITVGAFPITLLFSSLSYQLIRYAQHGFAQAYAPSVFGAIATPLTNQEQIGVLLGGAGLAVVVALIDFTLGRLKGSP